MVTTHSLINQRRDDQCFAITPERKYYRAQNSFVKRSLRPSEWQVSPIFGTIHVPKMGNQRLLNEAAALEYIQNNTDIPVPKLYACFEDDLAVILVSEFIEGVGMDKLDDTQRKVVAVELDRHLETLRSLRSAKPGGPSGIVVPPYRAMEDVARDTWHLKSSAYEEYVFCHNDLSQQNIIVDPVSLKIKAIIDWEYAGFFPAWFEKRFFERLGPSVALERYGEEDDSERVMNFLHAQDESLSTADAVH